MSKIGKKSIVIPQGVSVEVTDGTVKIKGPKGEASVSLHRYIQTVVEGPELKVSVKNPEDRRQKAMWGTFRSLLQNAITGLVAPWEKKLEIQGVGYKATIAGNKLTLALGYSHPVEIMVPKGLEVKVEKNVLTVSGTDRQMVGQLAAKIRSQRPPEPYKGKGVRYVGEAVRRKAGKVVKAVGG